MRGCLAFLRCPPPGSGPPSAHGAPGAGPRRPEMHLQREFPRPDGTGLAAGAGAASGGFLGCRSPLNFTVSKTTKGLGAGDLKRGRKGLRPRPRRLSSPRRASSCGTGGSPRSAPSPRGLREAGGGVRGGGRERTGPRFHLGAYPDAVAVGIPMCIPGVRPKNETSARVSGIRGHRANRSVREPGGRSLHEEWQEAQGPQLARPRGRFRGRLRGTGGQTPPLHL